MWKPTDKNRSDSGKSHQKLLLNKKTELLVALGINCKRLAEVRQEAGEDLISISHVESVRFRINRVLNGQLKQVESALDRLDSGDYGICLGCGMAISSKRLQAIPWASYCIACQNSIGLEASERDTEACLPMAS
ncbi:MAG: hypothetical protein A3H94_08530 [Acidobacteria bacterium RIFCSPLOWO2_02_FULL_60_20]|nr:MAG: hypothetical protein A3H94_08530 [Acidobacteria bacterium RIFCSPLOWO2_02_FULL_60_20]